MKRVLVIEDEVVLRTSVVRGLNRVTGLHVVGAGTLGYLGYGFQTTAPGTLLGGMPLNVQVLGGSLLPLTGTAPDPGMATFRLPIPNDLALQNLAVAFQLWTLDAAAPQGVSTSRATRFVVQ